MSMAQTAQLCISMGGKFLIRHLDWEVERGQLWCVLGKNGAGKTSLLHALAGLLPPSSGIVSLRGRPMSAWSLRELATMRGLMPQKQLDSFSHTALETVLVGRAPYRMGAGWESEEDRTTALSALELLGMREYAQADVRRLSGGERQRIALASLLVQNPELMLLDEPTSHQDVAQQLAVMRLVKEVSADHAVVATCHDINLAARFATHVLVLSENKHWQGRAQDMLNADVLEQAFGCSFDVARAGHERCFLAR